MMEETGVWVFNGEKLHFPSGVFSTLAKANRWIAENKLTGILTLYPIDQGTYAWAISKGYFSPETGEQKSATFMANFSHSAQEHYHCRNGREDDGSEDDD